MTNESIIRNLYTPERWARLQILKFESIILSNSEYEDPKFVPAYITTDGRNFCTYEGALEHQIDLYPCKDRKSKKEIPDDFNDSK